MGLFGNSFEFSGRMPSVDEVAHAMRTAMTEAILLTRTLATSATEEERELLKEAASALRLSEATVSIRLAADRQRRRRRDVLITVHLRARDVVVTGTHAKLWGATCKAIESLGGVKLRLRRISS
jgi:hypothetical protein